MVKTNLECIKQYPEYILYQTPQYSRISSLKFSKITIYYRYLLI
jgi:hypothetical protein